MCVVLYFAIVYVYRYKTAYLIYESVYPPVGD